MRKTTACITLVILFFYLSGCGNSHSTEASSAASAESGVTQQDVSEEKGMDGQTEPGENGSPKQEETVSDEEEPMRISVKSAEYEIIYELNDSQAARDLYAQLPLTLDVEPFSSNEMTFYPPEELNTDDTPLSGGQAGSLSYYSPWGDVVMFYAPCEPNGSLYELGTVVSGSGDIDKLSGRIEVSACD